MHFKSEVLSSKKIIFFGSVFSLLCTQNTLPPQFFPVPGKILNEDFDFKFKSI